MWMGWGRAEGSKKMKKKSCEEVTKGDYMDNKDIFYHTDVILWNGFHSIYMEF